jgi:hypothetical protein
MAAGGPGKADAQTSAVLGGGRPRSRIGWIADLPDPPEPSSPAEQLAQEINRLSEETDRISVLNPLNILYLRRIESKRAVLAPQVSQKLGEALGALRSAVDNAPGQMAGFLQT